ncbi:MAG TPA: S26 family signal peptidase [Candidatus Angelobacter sp.]|nr:S26 family signal peptidase [Candidatus Angelobacter sp.]
MKDFTGTLLFGAGMIVLCIFSTWDAGYRAGQRAEKPSQWWLAILLPFAFLAAAGHVNWATRASGFQVFVIPSRAMENTVMIGNRIMVDRWHYRQSEPSDGDIIVFKNPEGFYVLKRVIAHGARPLKAKMEWSLLMAGKFLNHM